MRADARRSCDPPPSDSVVGRRRAIGSTPLVLWRARHDRRRRRRVPCEAQPGAAHDLTRRATSDTAVCPASRTPSLVAGLPERRRTFKFAGYSYDEIAAHLR
jgi:hypothetical protein